MDIIESTHESGHCLKVTRSLDRTNAIDLDKSLALLWEKWEGAVFVDVSELQSIDSAGLTLFLKWHRRSLAQNRRLALVRPSAFHLKLMEITRLDEELVILNEPGGHRIRRAASGPYPGVARSGPAPVPAI